MPAAANRPKSCHRLRNISQKGTGHQRGNVGDLELRCEPSTEPSQNYRPLGLSEQQADGKQVEENAKKVPTKLENPVAHDADGAGQQERP